MHWDGSQHAPVPFHLTYPLSRVSHPPNTDYSEEGMWRYRLECQARERACGLPPVVPYFPVGTWAVTTYGDLYQLRWLEFDDPRVMWQECAPQDDDHRLAYAGKLHGVELYQQWLRQGSMPPALHAYEMHTEFFDIEQHRLTGHLIKISDGHHRGAALYREGYSRFQCWVNPI